MAEHLLVTAKKSKVASIETLGFHNLINLKLSCWDAFIKTVYVEYDGFVGYVKGILGFSNEDLAKIWGNLRGLKRACF